MLESYRSFAYYNQWANAKVYSFVGRLETSEFIVRREQLAGSLRGMLHHLLIADFRVMATLTGDEKGFLPRDIHGNAIVLESSSQCLYERFSELQVSRAHLDRQIVEYLAVVTESELSATVSFFEFDGERRKHTRSELLNGLFAHQLHHRGQLSVVLATTAGTPLGIFEYDTFLRESL
jgi:uncharacterized damage-inducible protein DinB